MIPNSEWIVWLVPIIFAFITLGISKLFNRKITEYFAITSGLISSVVALSMLSDFLTGKLSEPINSQINWIYLGVIGGKDAWIKVGLLVDPLSVFMANIVSIIGTLIFIFSLGYMAHEKDYTRYWFWMQIFLGSMLLLVMAGDLLMMLVGWEMVGLCSWQLISFWYKSKEKSPDEKFETEGEYNAHCGFKAFVMTSLGDIFFLIAIIMVGYATWSSTGVPTFTFTELQASHGWIKEIVDLGVFAVFAVFLFLGPVGKSAQFPLHEWLPDAMAGPTTVSALIHAATMVKAGVYFVARIVPIFYPALEEIGTVQVFFYLVMWTGLFTAFLAATQGMVAKEIKKVLAYSTVSQLGYMMFILGAVGVATSQSIEAYLGGTFHLLMHATFKALLFLGAGAVIHEVGSKYMHDYGGLSKYMPQVHITMWIGALSLAGIPPLGGYFSKELIFSTLYNAGMYWELGFGVLTAVLTAFYTIRMVGLTFYGKESENVKKLANEHKLHDPGLVMTIPLWILALFTVLLGASFQVVEEGFIPILENIEEVHVITLGKFFIHSFGLVSLIILATVLIVGVLPATLLYIFNMEMKWLTDNPVSKALHDFFYNRWYINKLYYLVFVDGLGWISQKSRKIQTGYLRVNMLYAAFGLLIYALIFAAIFGGF